VTHETPALGERPPLLRRLVVRIYLVCLAQLLVVVAGVAVLLHQSRIPESWLRRQGEYVVGQIFPVLQDHDALQRALGQLGDTAGARMTLYGLDRTILASNVEPVLPLPAALHAEPPILVLALVPPGPPGPFGHGGRPPPPPRHVDGPGGLERLIPPMDGPDHPPPGTSGVLAPRDGPPPRPPPPPSQGWAVLDLRPPTPPPWELASVAGLVLVVLGISSALLARSISRPLGTLSVAASRLGAGDLQARARLDRADELGEVGRAFDGMAERVVSLLRSEKALIAGVSHELRTPLSRIRVALELAEEGDVDTARASLADITDDLGELERLVDELLTAARLELGQAVPGAPVLRPRDVEAAALVATASERFLAVHPEHRLDASAADSARRLTADPGLVGRILNNLLDNAAKYSPPAAGWVQLQVRGTADAVTFTVEDHGAGIASEDLPHVFTPFFRSDQSRSRSTGGFGLGLSLARTIAEAHGGRLELDSHPGSGTRAILWLPRAGPGGTPVAGGPIWGKTPPVAGDREVGRGGSLGTFVAALAGRGRRRR